MLADIWCSEPGGSFLSEFDANTCVIHLLPGDFNAYPASRCKFSGPLALYRGQHLLASSGREKTRVLGTLVRGYYNKGVNPGV